jgi:cytosine/uracil/thiamine/allantoin permease
MSSRPYARTTGSSSPASSIRGQESNEGLANYGVTLATRWLNIPDFTRDAKSQESQIIGQAFALPFAMDCTISRQSQSGVKLNF